MARTHLALAVLAAAGLPALAAPAAWADPAPPLTAEQSTSLGRALRLWTLGMAGDATGYTATPTEGGYDVAIPVQGPIGTTGAHLDGGPVTAKASLAADGRWQFDAIMLPSPLHMTGPAMADGKALRMTQTYGTQTGSAVVDPTLAGPSSGKTLRTASVLRIEGPETPLAFTVAQATTQVEWVPASPGRVDAGSVTQLDDIAVQPAAPPGDAAAEVPGKPHDGVKIHSATITVQSTDADPDRASQLARRAIAFGTSLPAKDSDAGFTPEQRAELHGMVTLARDLAHSARQSIHAQGIAITSGRRQVGIDEVTLSQKLEAPDGKMDMHLRLEVSGLSIPGLPGALHDLVPKHLVIAPFVTGTPAEDLYAMADQEIDDTSDHHSLAADARTRLTKEPSTAGIEELAFDLGPAAITAHGQVTTSGPAAMDGTALIEATGLDALIQKAGADPMLRQGAPVLIFLKGIGEQDGEKTVWKLAYAGKKFTVNGTDISGLIPGK